MKKNIAWILSLGLILLLSAHFLQKISLVDNPDLGRHLKNGQLLLEKNMIVRTNYYSFTEPDNIVINHHLISGAIFYLIEKTGGMTALSIAGFLLSISAFLLFFKFSVKISGILPVLMACFILIPMLANRPQLRPELFSYLLFGLFYIILIKLKADEIRPFAAMLMLFFLQAAWANLHIYFPLGVIMTFIFMIDQLLNEKKDLFPVFLLITTSIACFLNINGFSGVTEPFLIMQNLTLIPAEFRSMLHFEHYFTGFETVHLSRFFYDFISVFSVAGVFVYVFRKRWKEQVFELAVFVFCLCFSWYMHRNMIFFALLLIPFLSRFMHDFLLEIKKKTRFIVSSVFSIILILQLFSGNYFPKKEITGAGKIKNEERLAKILNQKVSGHIFNNFDIGGYLIWYCFPQSRIFIDSRPEAYHHYFSKNIYWKLKSRNDQMLWTKLNQLYGFDAIVLTKSSAFCHNGFTTDIEKSGLWIKSFEDEKLVLYLPAKTPFAEIKIEL